MFFYYFFYAMTNLNIAVLGSFRLTSFLLKRNIVRGGGDIYFFTPAPSEKDKRFLIVHAEKTVEVSVFKIQTRCYVLRIRIQL